jgi:hypothetical protein
MLPDFPKQKRHIEHLLQEGLMQRMLKDPLVGMIPRTPLYEGSALRTHSPEGYEDTVPLQEHGFETVIPHDELVEKGPDAYFARLDEVAQQMLDAQKKMLIAKLEEVTAQTGNVFDARGKPFSPEMLLDAMEKIDVEFDDTGEPQKQSILMNPVMYASVKDKLAEWDKDPELLKRHAEVIEKKRKEWLDRENNRKLVD